MIRKILFTTAIVVLLPFFMTQYIWGQVPKVINYQGVLSNSSGVIVPDGNYNLTFKLYDGSTGGTELWSETQSLQISKGIFNANLGNVNPLNLSFDKPYWLGITVGTGTELTPRILLTTSSYSFRAANTDSINDITAGGDLSGVYPNPVISSGAVTSSKIASGQVVKSINTLKDSVTLAAGTNVSITPSGNTLTISAAGGGGGTITGVTAGTGLSGGGGSGNVTLNTAIPFSLSASSNNPIISGINTGNSWGVYGVSTVRGVYGINSSSSNYGILGDASEGVFGNSSGGYGVRGISTSSWGVYGESSSQSGIVGTSSTGDGVYGQNTGSSNYGVLGGANAGVIGNSSGGYGVEGNSSSNDGVYGSSGYVGVYGKNSSSGNYGILGDANEAVLGWSYGNSYGVNGENSSNGTGVVGGSVSGYGVSGTSTNGVGVQGSSSSNSGIQGFSQNAIGIIGENLTSHNYGYIGTPTTGVAGNSSSGTGVYGTSSSGTGVFGTSSTGTAIYASGNFTATGTKAATVKLNNGSQVELYAEEAAEVYFTDYGSGTLVNGREHIQIDPTFLQTVTINAQHPLMVFVQPEGDCKGVYVTNKTSTGFDVVELQGGVSNVPFVYRVVCKRKYYEDERLATLQQSGQYTKQMMEAAWPEVIAKEKAEQEKMKAMQIEKKQ